MNISAPFIKRPVATSLLSMGLFLFGALAFPFLPVATLPEVEYPTITVFANLPGAAPKRWPRPLPLHSSGCSAASPV